MGEPTTVRQLAQAQRRSSISACSFDDSPVSSGAPARLVAAPADSDEILYAYSSSLYLSTTAWHKILVLQDNLDDSALILASPDSALWPGQLLIIFLIRACSAVQCRILDLENPSRQQPKPKAPCKVLAAIAGGLLRGSFQE
ncbi:hypothetical protein ZWY2020_011713 [Hordeum vulgare]|nr:hypothetical protein ZWY2020_011713 [Hordeum vulgare]